MWRHQRLMLCGRERTVTRRWTWARWETTWDMWQCDRGHNIMQWYPTLYSSSTSYTTHDNWFSPPSAAQQSHVCHISDPWITNQTTAASHWHDHTNWSLIIFSQLSLLAMSTEKSQIETFFWNFIVIFIQYNTVTTFNKILLVAPGIIPFSRALKAGER